MLKKIILFFSTLVLITFLLPSFAISPGAGQAQMQNNMQEMQKNKQNAKQMRQNQEMNRQERRQQENQ